MTSNPTTNAPLILCENLVKIYKVDELEVVALQGLDLEVRRGEFLAIVGASGSGKSSLLNTLGGLDRPSAGRVTVAGHDLLKMSDAALARYRLAEVGFVWQQASRNLLSYLTAQENVELPMLAAGVASAAATTHALELLEEVGLADRRQHRLAQLSGGQQQRIALAVALANRPQLLLADEPTGEVDSATAQRIWQVLRQLSARYGLTTVIVTHDRAIARVVDRVVSIRDGKTSTETIRQRELAPAATVETTQTTSNPVTPNAGTSTPAPTPEERFEERTVLDVVGRLQIPREYLEQRGIKTRAMVQLVEDGILIQRIGDEVDETANRLQEEEAAKPSEGVASSSLFAGGEQDPLPVHPVSRWRRLFGRARQPRVSAGPTTSRFSSEPFAHTRSASQAAGDNQPLVEIANLSRVYHVGGEAVQALRQVDLTIERQRLVVFKGRSGSGKTTLLNLIGGLDTPTTGHVKLFGQDLGKLSNEQRTDLRQTRLGFVFQAFSLMPTFSALENVEMLLRVARLDEAERRARALHCLTLVGLRRWADHRPFEMSGGQQQRLSIARALACRPEILIADEPTSNLDSETGRQVFQLFQRLVQEEGFTVLMASHDPMSDEFATEVYELSDGRIANQGRNA